MVGEGGQVAGVGRGRETGGAQRLDEHLPERGALEGLRVELGEDRARADELPLPAPEFVAAAVDAAGPRAPLDHQGDVARERGLSLERHVRAPRPAQGDREREREHGQSGEGGGHGAEDGRGGGIGTIVMGVGGP